MRSVNITSKNSCVYMWTNEKCADWKTTTTTTQTNKQQSKNKLT